MGVEPKSYTPLLVGIRSGKIVMAPNTLPVASGIKKSCKISCCSRNPLEPYIPRVYRKVQLAENKELWYGKNDKDWATRMLIS
jgi:hypothetical protein